MDSNMTSLRNLINGTQAGLQRKDTINVSAGSATVSSTITITKGVTIQGAGIGSSIITASTTVFDGQPDSTAIGNSGSIFPCANCENIKIDGFTIDGNNTQDIFILLEGASGISGTKAYCCFIVSNLTLKNSSPSSTQGVITATNGNGNGQLRGVITHILFDRTNVYLRAFSNNDTAEASNTAFNGPMKFDGTGLGTTNCLFIEDSTIQFSSSYTGNNPGWSETGQGACLVQRYLSFNFTNVTTPQELNDVHGFQGWPGGNTGTVMSERYGLTYTGFNGFRWFDIRGGAVMVHNNILTAPGGGPDVEVYGESATNFCPASIAPTPVNYNPLLLAYFFNNTSNGTEKPAINGFGGSFACTIAENNGNALGTVGSSSQGGWWNLNTGSCISSSCTQGIGRGTTAPTGTCTKGTGYWVASTATPTVNSAVIQTGKFYVCTATNTWTQFYTPAAYPHPVLASGSGMPAATPSPTSLTFVSQLVSIASPTQTIALTNGGAATLSITSIVASGDFSQSNNCGASLNAASSCTIIVTFTPTLAGQRIGTITITDNASDSPQSVALTGTGVGTVSGIGNIQIQGNIKINP